MTNSRPLRLLAIAASLTLAACGAREEAPASGDSAAASAAAAAEKPGSLEGPRPSDSATAAPATPSGRMIDAMQARLAAAEGMSAEQLKATLPEHRQAAANLIAEMNREMRGMNMTGDAAWTALVDSLRRDLTTMPDLAAGELRAMMPAHRARLTRLMQMHRDMMKGMKM